MVIESKVDPKIIAEEFIIEELLKMFPDANNAFYDTVRFETRKLKTIYGNDKFWRLIAGMSEGYMLKRLFRMLKGSEFEWNLEEVRIEDLYVRMLSGKVQEILKSVDFSAKKAGEILRKMPPKERLKILDPFKLNKDTYPILVHEEDGKLILHDGNRRTLDAAVFGMETLKAYVGRVKTPKGKPAMPEDFYSNLLSIFKDTDKITDELVDSVMVILKEFKKSYLNGPQFVDQYIKEYFMAFLNRQQQVRAQEILEMKVEN